MLHPLGVKGWNAGIILDWHTVGSQVVGENEGASMSKVFFGGSRSLRQLSSAVRTRLRNVITQGHTVLVGDADGMDKTIQSFFAEEGYRNVVVYCMEGECRNNVGRWPVESVSSGGRNRGFAYFSMKDAKMSLEAQYGFMIWDGESKGTLNNVLSLIEQGKVVLVYRSPSQEFLQIKSIEELENLLGACPPEVIEYLNKKIKLDERTAAATQSPLSF